jgi:hypothetical protein
MAESDEYLTAAEARDVLGISGPRMAQMLREGQLEWERSPVDRRIKLVCRAQVMALAAKSGKKTRPTAT